MACRLEVLLRTVSRALRSQNGEKQSFVIVAAGTACAQVGCDARVGPLGILAGGGDFDVRVKQCQRLLAACVSWIGGQESIQRDSCLIADHGSVTILAGSIKYPLVTSSARILRRASNITLYKALRSVAIFAANASSGMPSTTSATKT